MHVIWQQAVSERDLRQPTGRSGVRGALGVSREAGEHRLLRGPQHRRRVRVRGAGPHTL